MNFIDPSDFQNMTSDLLAMIFDEKMGLGKFGDMSIKSLPVRIQEPLRKRWLFKHFQTTVNK